MGRSVKRKKQIPNTKFQNTLVLEEFGFWILEFRSILVSKSLLPRFLIKTGIVLFCLWQMAAIAIWAQPTNFFNSKTLRWMQNKIPYVLPYILVTSQWQHWNLFPVSPSVAVNEEFLEKQDENGRWTIVRTIDGNSLGFFEQGNEVVLMFRMTFEGLVVAREPYMQDFCRSQHLRPGTSVRIRRRFAPVPPHLVPQSVDWWRSWKPVWSDVIDFSTICKPTL